MAGLHRVKQGEHISSLAEKYGFADHRTIWNHPNNEELKQKRKNPDILMPGDSVFIPDRTIRIEMCPTDQRHKFKTHREPLKLRLVLERFYDRPIADRPCDLFINTTQFHLSSDGNGLLEQKIPRSAENALLVVKDTVSINGDKVPVTFQVPVRIGDLNPLEEPSGQRARLANLGYYRLNGEEIDPLEIRSAVEEFQCENGLTVDGVCGPMTQSRMKEVYGC